MNKLYLGVVLLAFIIPVLATCTLPESIQPAYLIHFENNTISEVNNTTSEYQTLNESVMDYLSFIAYASERLVTPEELEKELQNTDYLEINSTPPITIQTIPGLNPQWQEGWNITSDRIIIKLGTVVAEERIFTFHPDQPGIRAWRSLKDVDTIII